LKTLKHKLHNACLSQLNNRLETLTIAIRQIQASANEETKSSAGDKYETGRAMAQLEIEKHNLQLEEVKRMKQDLTRIDPLHQSDVVITGSLVFTDRGNFYIAINAGEIDIDQKKFITISAAAPLAQKLIGLRTKSSFSLNAREFTILEIQ
jgi:transcription elongation GreA/GreB family factor